MITKQQLINGLSTYIKQFVVPHTTDTWSKRIVAAFADMLQLKPDMLDKYEILNMISEDGLYDIDLLEQVILRNIDDYGNITLTILGGSYTFNKSDIANLKGIL